ncbi:MAG: hypothetical protein ACI4RA_05600 [Kiritimatiellia bacterium]
MNASTPIHNAPNAALEDILNEISNKAAECAKMRTKFLDRIPRFIDLSCQLLRLLRGVCEPASLRGALEQNVYNAIHIATQSYKC